MGLYRLTLRDRSVEPLVHEVPATDLTRPRPVVHADDDTDAPEVRPDNGGPRRPLAVCDNLEVSDDGRRIYFSEPFDYTDAIRGRRRSTRPSRWPRTAACGATTWTPGRPA